MLNSKQQVEKTGSLKHNDPQSKYEQTLLALTNKTCKLCNGKTGIGSQHNARLFIAEIILVYFQRQVGVSKMEEFQRAETALERQDTPEQRHMESLVYTV